MPPASSMFIIILVPLLGNPDTTTIILITQILNSAYMNALNISLLFLSSMVYGMRLYAHM